MSMPDSAMTLIKDIRPGLRQLTSDFIVLDIYQTFKTKEGKDVATIKVADCTGSINVVLYGDYVSALQPSDVLRMTQGYAVVNKGSMCLYMAKHGSLTKIGEFCFLFSEFPDMSDPKSEFLVEFGQQQQQQQNGRGNSPPSFDMPPEPAGGPGFVPGGAMQQGRPQPGAHHQPHQAPWSLPGSFSAPNMPPMDPSGRLQPPNFDLSSNSGRTGVESPPHTAASPPPSDQPMTGPRVIPSQSSYPPASGAPPVSTSGPVDPRASRGGQNRYHPYQQSQPQQQQRQPLQPIGSGPGGPGVKAPSQQGPQSRSFNNNVPPSSRSGPPVIPSNPVNYRQAPSVRR